MLETVHDSKWLHLVPWSALIDEDQGTHNDTGQGDAHTSNDPRHGALVYVVQAIREAWKIKGCMLEATDFTQRTTAQFKDTDL